MADPLDRLIYRLGWLAARAGDAARHTASRAHDLEERLEAGLGSLEGGFDADDVARASAWGAGAVAGLVLARVLRPRRVDWRRAALAGVLATLAYDLVSWLDEGLGEGEGLAAPDLPAGPEAVARLVARYTAGVGLATVYAKYLHRRIPGPRMLGGLAFGVADGAAGAAGGLLPLAHLLAPSVPLPFAARGLTPGAQVTLRSLVRHAAFGAVLGAAYDDGEA
jgi:4-hydroxybenzoate polyprenyltransferase